MNRVKFYTLGDFEKIEYIKILTTELCRFFDCSFEQLPDNYGGLKDWGLIKLIENDEVDTYQMCFLDDVLLTASGGIIREIDNEKIYQAGFRWLHNIKTQRTGLAKLTFTDTPIKHQIDRAKITNCDKIIFSFNEHNYKLFLTSKKHFERDFADLDIDFSTEPKMFNNTPQWLISIILNK